MTATTFFGTHDWRDPLRMVLAAILAYAVANALHMPEFYWAVLTALIVTRPGVGATMQAGSARLIGTLCGAGLAALVAAARSWHPPEILLLLAVLLPLGALITWRADWRTAPIAAIIVLSSGPIGASPLHAALLRIGEIGLGAAIGIAVSWILLPTRAAPRSRLMLGRCLTRLAAMLQAALAADDARAEMRRDSARDALRSLTLVARSAWWERADKMALEQTVKRATRLYNDMAFLVRVIDAARGAGSVAVAAQSLADVAARFAALVEAIAARQTVRPALAAFDRAVDALVHDAVAAGDVAGDVPGDSALAQHEQALRYLLRTVQSDLRGLLKGLKSLA